jgi:hypothetical protein
MDTNLYKRTNDSLILLAHTSNPLFEYEIEYDRMATPERVLGWVRQLSDKNWVTREHIAILVRTAEDIGVKIV